MSLNAPVVSAEEPIRGVAGVEVSVKESPSKRFVTDARGNFAFQGLAPGSYTLLFRAQKAKDAKMTAVSAVTVAQSYSIKVIGTKRPASRTALSDQLLAGVTLPVEVGTGAQIRGQVGAAHAAEMVWVGPELGSHIPGHWVPKDSPEAKGHGARAVHYLKEGKDLQDMMDRHDPMHQEGFPIPGGR